MQFIFFPKSYTFKANTTFVNDQEFRHKRLIQISCDDPNQIEKTVLHCPQISSLWSLLTVGVYGVGVEERPLFAAAAVGSTLGVLTPNPVELLVEADDDFVKEPVFKVFVASAVDGRAARKSVLHP